MKRKTVKAYALVMAVALLGTLLGSCGTQIKPYELVSKQADTETRKLFDWLQKQYGKKIISGQQMYDPAESEEATIYRETGLEPAIKGFDMLNQTGSYKDKQVDMAIDWHQKSNGIVTFCWHWSEPMTRSGAYSDKSSFSVTNAVTEGTEEYQKIIEDIDAIAVQLKRLQDAHVPVLWRPLHEAAGKWFWWGKQGAEPYLKLWNIIYDRLENHHKLTNLIWVWNGQHADWYVGDDKCDIAGHDVYFVKDSKEKMYEYNSGRDLFMKNVAWTNGKKMIALSENDQIPNPDKLFDKKYFEEPDEYWVPDVEEELAAKLHKSGSTPWLYWCTWWGGFVNGEDSTKFDMLKQIYQSKYVITLKDLPEWDDDLRRELGKGAQSYADKSASG